MMLDVISFASIKAAKLTPFFLAMLYKVSPFWTVYVLPDAEGALGVVEVICVEVVVAANFNDWFTKMISVLRLFHAFKSATETPFADAILYSVSPFWTVYTLLVTAGTEGVVTVGVVTTVEVFPVVTVAFTCND